MSFRRWFIVACWGSAILAIAPAESFAQIGIGQGLRVDAPSSLKARRDRHVVKQRLDFSCGAAALATLLRFGFGDTVTEGQILNELFDLLSAEEKTATRETGFSLLHLQRVAQARGYNAEGFRLDAKSLSMLGGPVIVFIEPRGYKHFAVLRGVEGNRVHLADPSRGNIRMPRYAFLRDWLQSDHTGIIFVVEPKMGLPVDTMPLTLHKRGRPLPEIMTAREMTTVGNVLVR
ncbi:MAG: C39 family peptidase [Vicinamibacterales bacterium]